VRVGKQHHCAVVFRQLRSKYVGLRGEAQTSESFFRERLLAGARSVLHKLICVLFPELARALWAAWSETGIHGVPVSEQCGARNNDSGPRRDKGRHHETRAWPLHDYSALWECTRNYNPALDAKGPNRRWISVFSSTQTLIKQ
jgi:hypothetical protein